MCLGPSFPRRSLESSRRISAIPSSGTSPASFAKGPGNPSFASGDGRETRSPTSPIWQAVIERYYSELAKGGIKAATIDKEVWNIQRPDELIAQIGGLSPVQGIQSNVWSKVLSRLQPVLLGLNDFAALTAWVMGMNGKVAAVLWGSIRLIIRVRSAVV